MPGCPCLDGTAALSPFAAGMHQSGGTTWSRSPNYMQEHVKVFCLAGKNGSAYRAKWSNLDAQIAKLETSQLRNLSQEVFMRDSKVSQLQIEGTDTNQASRGLYMQSKDCERDDYAGGVHSYGSHVHARQSMDAFPGNAPVIEPFMKEACTATIKPFEPSSDAGDHSASMSESPHHDEVEAFQGSDVVTAAGMQHVDMEMEDRVGRNEHLAEGLTNNHQGLSSFTDAHTSGSTNGMQGSLSLAHMQCVHDEYGNGGEDASKPTMECMVVNESTSTSTTSRIIAAVRVPNYRASTLQKSLNESRCYLESLGVDCNKLFEREPSAKLCTVEKIKAWVSALERYGIQSMDAGKIFNISPKVLLVDPEKDLEIVTSFLFNEAGLSPKAFSKVMRRCPHVLVADLNTQLRPTLSFLRTLGYSRMSHVFAINPSLLSYGVESRLLPRLRLFESWGFTYREAAAMVVRFPALFNYSATENLQRKYDYLLHEMGASKTDLLAFPQYFGYSLEARIRPRHQCIAKLKVPLSIHAMLTLSEAQFHAKFGHVEGESAVSVDEACSEGNSQVGPSLYESIEAKLHLHECGKELPAPTSFENPETLLLVRV